MVRDELNIFLSVDDPFRDGFDLDLFSVGELPRGEERYKILRYLSGAITRKFKLSHATWYTPSLKESHLAVLPQSIKETEFTIDNFTVKKAGVRRLYTTSFPDEETLSRLLYQSARTMLTKSGFWKKYYNVFMKNQPSFTSERCEIYKGFTFRLDIFSNGKVGLSIDYTTTLVGSLDLWEQIRKSGIQAVQRWITTRPKGRKKGKIGRNVFEHKLKRISRIVSLDPKKTVDTPSFTDPSTKRLTSVIEYQKNRYGITSIQRSEPIVFLRYGESLELAHHAPSLLKPILTTDEVSPEIQKEHVFLPPHRRWRAILDYRNALSSLQLANIKVEFNTRMASYQDFPFGLISFPSLVFEDGQTVKPRNYEEVRNFKTDCLMRYGPFEKPTIMETCLIYRADFNRDVILEFYNDLKDCMQKYYRTALSPKPREISTKDYYDLAEKISEYRDRMKTSFFIVFLPSKEAPEYDFVKAELPAPSQGISMANVGLKDSIKKMTDEERKSRSLARYCGIVFTVATGIFIQAGGLPWILGDPLHADCHIGIDVGGKEAKVACYGYLFDNQGRIVGTDTGTAQTGEIVETGRIKMAIKKLLSKAKCRPNMRIIICRDGRLSQEERQGIIEAVQEVVDPITVQTLNLSIAEIHKDVPYRMFGRKDRLIQNPVMGRFALVDGNLGVLCTTGYPLISKRVAQPLLVKLLNLYGQIDIRKVLGDIFYLSELNWIAGNKPTKLPIVISLAENRALFAEKGVSPASRLPV
jgi:hypothetical protein